MSNFTKWHRTHFQNFTCVFTILVKFDTHIRKLFWCYYRWLITCLTLEKCKKKNAIFLKLFLYKGFVHWKLKLLNFLVDSFRLNQILLPVVLCSATVGPLQLGVMWRISSHATIMRKTEQQKYQNIERA